MRIAWLGIGAPGSGKTTFLEPLAIEMDAFYICPDRLRYFLTGNRSDHSQEELVWKIAYREVQEAFRAGRSIVFDATNAQMLHRLRLLKHLRESGAEQIIGIWFNTPVEECLLRDDMRGCLVPSWKIASAHRSLMATPPHEVEGFDKLLIFNR